MHVPRGWLATLDVLALTAGLWFMGKFLRYAFPPLFEPLQATYGVSNAVIGLAFTGFMLSYAAMQFPAGVIADRIGPVRVIVAGALVAALAAVVLVVDSPFALLVVAMVVIGAGTGVHKTVAVTLLARVYPARTGRALGAHDTVGAFSGVVAPVAAVALLDGPGWRTLFLVAGLVGIALAATFALRVPHRLPPSPADEGVESSDPAIQQYVVLFSDRRFSLFVIVTILFSFTYNGLVAFLPLYLVDVAGLSVAFAGLLYSLLFTATVAQLATGELSDRVGRLHVITACLGFGLVGIGLLLTQSTPIGLAFAVVVFGIGGHGYRPVRGAYLMSIVPPSFAGGGIGIVRTLLMGAGAIAPAVVGMLSDLVGFRFAFGVLAASITLATVCAVVLLLFPASPSQPTSAEP